LNILANTLAVEGRPFLGAADSPLLAPRGVFLVNNHLLVADTAQNRVFLWRQLPESEHAPPDLVLGQPSGISTGRNAHGAVHAGSLFYPSGLWSDGRRLIVADAWNHRVLIWRELPQSSGQAADVVIGQPGFEQNDPNVRGIGAAPHARSLHWPYGLFSDGRRLWIADTGNRRILYFDQIPEENYAPADGLIGKASFEERDYETCDPVWPYSVKVGPRGELAITDTQYYRVLLWRDWRTAFRQRAETVIGQPGLEANGQNQYRWFPEAHTLNWCYDTCFYRDGLWVADTGNSRLLWFENLPQNHNPAADGLLGQPDFQTGSDNLRTLRTTENSLYWPFQICTEGTTLVAADTGNHRILIYQLNP